MRDDLGYPVIFWEKGNLRVLCGDAEEALRTLPDRSVQMCVTSPPFYGLRDFGVDGQIGLEDTPDLWVERLVAVFREVRRVLRDDGTLWVEVGDSYVSSGERFQGGFDGNNKNPDGTPRTARHAGQSWGRIEGEGLKPKDLLGQPWLLAFALRADGWYLRSDIIWARPNPMPESVTDRPTKAHSYLFLLSKKPRYFYDVDAIREPASENTHARYAKARETPKGEAKAAAGEGHKGWDSATNGHVTARNARSVWTITTQPLPFEHYAAFPEELARRAILAGSAPGDTVLDPFLGSGTTLRVAKALGRGGIGIELNEKYCKLAVGRITGAAYFEAAKKRMEEKLGGFEQTTLEVND